MKKLIYVISTTLDGFMAGPHGELDAVAPSMDSHQCSNDLVRSASALLFGRATYELLTSFWDTVDLANPSLSPVEVEFAQVFRATPRVVFSRTLDSVGDNAVLVKDDIAGRVSELKRQTGGPLLLGCGAELLAAFAALDLIDEYRITVNPVLLSRGKPVFTQLADRVDLTLRETRTFENGAVLLTYDTKRAPATTA